MSTVMKCDQCGSERLSDEETGWYSAETTTLDGRSGYTLGDFCSADCLSEYAANDERERRRFEALTEEEQERELAS